MALKFSLLVSGPQSPSCSTPEYVPKSKEKAGQLRDEALEIPEDL